MGGGSGEGTITTTWKLKKAAKNILLRTCGSFSRVSSSSSPPPSGTPLPGPTTSLPPTVSSDLTLLDDFSPVRPNEDRKTTAYPSKNGCQPDSTTNTSSNNKNLCAICLDPLNYSSGSSSGQAIFTAQCSHAFHFACISSNVSHGSLTCPICRTLWSQLPRSLNTRSSFRSKQSDPVLRILDDSIANFRVHRRSFLRSARYDDDDPIEPHLSPDNPRLYLSLLPVSFTQPSFPLRGRPNSGPNLFHRRISYSSEHTLTDSPSWSEDDSPYVCASRSIAYLSVKIAHQPATDLVLIASPNGPHLRLMKQAMALVVFSMRPMDRLAIVTYSSAASRVFPLRCMNSYGKRTALQIIDRLFYTGQADPVEGLKKGVKILGDRLHRNHQSCILHLSDSPVLPYNHFDLEVSVTIHRFHMGYGFGTSNGFVMHEFEEFLARILRGFVREVQLRIDDEARIIKLGELRGGEERRIALSLGESGRVFIEYSYIDGVFDGCLRTGDTVLSIGDKRERSDSMDTIANIGGRISSVESWDYHDPFMARRWAKHLHGYRL